MHRRPLTAAHRDELLRTFEHTAFRLELQDSYDVPSEHRLVRTFISGRRTPPTDSPAVRRWFDQVADHVEQGKRIERVRVHSEPPTPYQEWIRWASSYSAEAGETIYHLSQSFAHKFGLLPAAGDADWWLLDSRQLIVTTYDDAGHRTSMDLVTDTRAVLQACQWRDLAVHASTVEASLRSSTGGQ